MEGGKKERRGREGGSIGEKKRKQGRRKGRVRERKGREEKNMYCLKNQKTAAMTKLSLNPFCA